MASSTVAQGESLGCTNPKLDIETLQGSPGAHIDVNTLEYIIYDVSTGSDVQVQPVSGRATADVVNDCPTGDRLSTGHYVARWDISVSEPLGEHRIDWFIKRTASSPEVKHSFCFTVLPEVVGLFQTSYCSVAEIRAEGITVAMADDDRLETLAEQASRLIEQMTGRVFAPTAKTIRLDGNGGRAILLNEPIISVEELRFRNDPFSDFTNGDLIDPELYEVFNRHITQNLLNPDDRNNPRIEFIHGDDFAGREFVEPRFGNLVPSYFPRGVQNIEIKGVFGYTDYDGGSSGTTPSLISKACMLLAIRGVPQAGNSGQRLKRVLLNELKRERTRDQEYETHRPTDVPRASFWFTGDPEIDAILTIYKRPILVGAV